MRNSIVILTLTVMLIMGCSGGNPGPSIPGVVPDSRDSNDCHMLWGLWQGVIDPDAGAIDFVQLRTPDFHLNALPFLEPPPLLNLTLESLEFNGDIIEADIGLRHPFLGLTEFTGFDVCGIFISNGTITGFADDAIRMSGEGDTRLLNPDGYARWWNPAEFPNDGTMFGYSDGLLGSPDSYANFNATVNAYKYYCDDLDDTDDTLADVDIENRGMFSAGQKNIRHYTIEVGEGLIFNYAIDANWQFPDGDAPWSAPEDFAPEANRIEAWRVSISELDNSLWNDGVDNGGDLSLSIDVYDWVNAGLNTVRVESPGNFTVVESAAPINGGDGFSTYEIEISSATPSEGEIELLISVVSEEEDFGGFINGTNSTAYFLYTALVSDEPAATFSVDLDASHYFDTSGIDFAPAVFTSPADHVYVGFYRNHAGISNTPDYEYSEDSGASWLNPYFNTFGNNTNFEVTKFAVDAIGDVYHLCGSIPGPMSAIARCATKAPYHGLYPIPITYGNALIFTDDGYPVAFGDTNQRINYRKGDTPNDPWQNGSWGGWNTLPVYIAVPSPARLSQTRDIVKDTDGTIYFTYFSSNISDTWIHIAYNSDGLATSWNTGNVVYNGLIDGYDSAHDPCLIQDPDGIFHSAFILHASSPSDAESIAYVRSSNALDWTTPVIAYETVGTGHLFDPTVEVVEVAGTEILVLTYREDDKIYLVFSWDEGVLWQTPTLLSTGNDIQPDTSVTSDGYVHTVWEHDEGTDLRIEYIRAHFVED